MKGLAGAHAALIACYVDKGRVGCRRLSPGVGSVQLFAVDEVVAQLVALDFGVAVILVIEAALEAFVVVEHFPEGNRVGDAGFFHALGVVPVNHTIDHRYRAELGGDLAFVAFGLHPGFAIDFGVLGNDVGHRVHGMQ